MRTTAEYLCLSLLWIGTAGLVSSVFLTSQSSQIMCMGDFIAVIAIGCLTKLLIVDREANEGAQASAVSISR